MLAGGTHTHDLSDWDHGGVKGQSNSGDAAHRVPVVGDLLQAQRLANVDKVQDVLLEAGAAEADAGIQELGSDARVRPDRVRHLREVRASDSGGA